MNKLVNFFLEKGADPSKVRKEDESALIYASNNNLPQIVDLLMRFNADEKYQDSNGDTPLMHAIRHGHLDVIQTILEFGQKEQPEETMEMIQKENKSGQTALSIALKNINKGVRFANEVIIDKLLEYEPKLNMDSGTAYVFIMTHGCLMKQKNEKGPIIDQFELPTGIEQLIKINVAPFGSLNYNTLPESIEKLYSQFLKFIKLNEQKKRVGSETHLLKKMISNLNDYYTRYLSSFDFSMKPIEQEMNKVNYRRYFIKNEYSHDPKKGNSFVHNKRYTISEEEKYKFNIKYLLIKEGKIEEFVFPFQKETNLQEFLSYLEKNKGIKRVIMLDNSCSVMYDYSNYITYDKEFIKTITSNQKALFETQINASRASRASRKKNPKKTLVSTVSTGPKSTVSAGPKIKFIPTPFN